MLIAMVSEHASPLATRGGADAGGQSGHVAALARHLAAEGHHVDIHTRRDSPDLPERVPLADGVDVVHVDAGPPGPLPEDELLRWLPAFAGGLTRRFADPERRPDVVHAHFWTSGLAAVRAARSLATAYPPAAYGADSSAARGGRLPVVQTFHTLGSVERRHQGAADTSPRGRVAAEAGLCRDVDLVVATCSDEARELRALGADLDRVRVVPRGVDLGTFTPGSGHAFRWSSPLRVLALGRLVERTRVATLVEALPALPGVVVLVAGGPPADALDADPEVRRLRDLAAEHEVADRVTFLGAVAHEDVPALIRSVDVVACTPWYEPFGIVPLEAAACGRPVVASAVGGMLDSVVHQHTGLLVPPRCPDAVVDALRRLEDPWLRQRLGDQARGRAEELYGWATVARRTLAAYEEVVGAMATVA